MLNAFTVDVEDWFCSHNLWSVTPPAVWDACDLRLADPTLRILDLLARRGVEATFFVLGWVAERAPRLIETIAEAGHEIACHGYAHRPITSQTPDELRQDIARALACTQPLSRAPIEGYRAPAFTITPRTLWALDLLREHGFRYDSSIYPFGYHPNYGLPGAPLGIHVRGGRLVEVPMSCAEIGGLRVPCSGGGYLRLLPYPLLRRCMRRCNDQGRPVIFYIHPWELDTGQPEVRLPPLRRFRHYQGMGTVPNKLEHLLKDFTFTSIRRLLAEATPAIT